jgi:hypothetical protein
MIEGASNKKKYMKAQAARLVPSAYAIHSDGLYALHDCMVTILISKLERLTQNGELKVLNNRFGYRLSNFFLG